MNTMAHFRTKDGTEKIPATEGLALNMLQTYDTIHARTCNSEYQIFIFDPQSGRALIQGGSYQTKLVAATVTGSTDGDGRLKEGWLGVGLCLEIDIHGRRLVTTPIRSLTVSRDHRLAF